MTDEETLTVEIEVPRAKGILYRELLDIVQSNLQTLVDKNQDYGDIRESARTMADMGVFDDPETAFAHRGFSRLTEKHSRYAQLQFNDTERRVADEDLEEVCLDAMNYWLWQAWLHRHGISERVHNSPWTVEFEDDALFDGTGAATDGMNSNMNDDPFDADPCNYD